MILDSHPTANNKIHKQSFKFLQGYNMNNFDKVVVEARETFIRLNRQFAEELLAEIKNEGYTTISDVKGALFNTLDALRLSELQEMSLQYQADANADHFTGNQF